MKTLWILRHAKSSWDDVGLPDHERPLAPRGRKASKRVSRFAEASGVRPQLVLCSTALRARDTLARVLPGLGEPAVEQQRTIYLASADTLLALLRRVGPDVESVMLVGHNPGLHDLVCALAPPGPEALPTGALAEVRLEIEAWSEIAPGSGLLARLTLPRELA